MLRKAFIRHYSSTIFALSSGFGKCGVAVIRVSGEDTAKALKTIAGFKENKLPARRTALLRSLRHPKSNDLIDKGLILWFPGPNSFTGEDSCEFQIHGGPAVIEAMLDSLSHIKGLRPAAAGEFTRRAFFNGKLDLTKVEGLADLIHAETEAQRKQALLQANGALSQLYSRWRTELIRQMAHIEAWIDFSEDENIEADLLDRVIVELKRIKAEIEEHLDDGRKGERLREGVRTAIIGAPNVGKSSLLNTLCQRPKSIISDIPGTTRDVIESALNIGGFPMLLADTAGLRAWTEDVIEREGISRAKECARMADLVVLVADASQVGGKDLESYFEAYLEEIGVSQDDLKDKNVLKVLNKIDLVSEEDLPRLKEGNCINISCTIKRGVKEAVKRISEELKSLCADPSAENPTLSHTRHRHMLIQAKDYLEDFLSQLEADPDCDLAIACQKLRLSVRSIGTITGEVHVEEVLDVIFRDFCIGK